MRYLFSIGLFFISAQSLGMTIVCYKDFLGEHTDLYLRVRNTDLSPYSACLFDEDTTADTRPLQVRRTSPSDSRNMVFVFKAQEPDGKCISETTLALRLPYDGREVVQAKKTTTHKDNRKESSTLFCEFSP